MMRYMKWLVVLLIIGGIAWKVYDVSSTTHEDVPDAALLPTENVCLGLNYHRVKQPNTWNKLVENVTGSSELVRYNVYADKFEQQMTWLQEEGVYFATQDDLLGYRAGEPIPDKCVWISFDDVDHTVYENAFPILKDKQIPFTLFIITGHVGEAFQNLDLAPWTELKDMQASGLADFGTHTHDMHYVKDGGAVFLPADMQAELRQDLETSVAAIEKNLGTRVTTIAYPFGNTSDAVTETVQDLGFEQAFILSPNPITPDNDPFYSNRYLLDAELFELFVKPYFEQH